MESLKNYSSSDSEEEEEIQKNVKKQKVIPVPVQSIEIFSQHKQMRTNFKTSSLFSYIPWNPSFTTTKKLDKLTSFVTESVPLLNQNYEFKPVNKDIKRLIKYHMTIFPTTNIENENLPHFINDIKTEIEAIKPSEKLLRQPHNSNVEVLNIFNSTKYLNLKFENNLILGRSPTKNLVFLCGVIKLNSELEDYFDNIIKNFNISTKQNHGQVQFPDLLKDKLHITLATGYPKTLNTPTFEVLENSVKSVDVSSLVDDIDIDVNEIIIRDMASLSKYKIDLVS
ncbi:uncharacterized protein KGF55_003557 [Candida pseudojiufengensis]|uniref:uncharacterized protein n=1 Tax=Candida pseudojiufengensis TaxID=497109 RepID=UPI00222481A0|nr:uncharacterized protein KGF55_003557 [Candida pseudojiufengensis]KAI5962481.1 hypothetical protein KGF55_003557 [Candida pseudojiufengensis]